VEGAGHHSVSQVERFFNSVAVVDVDVDVQHALVGLQQLQDGQHAIVDIAKP
jgi:sensor domain CHASE-containing protein